MKDKTSADDWKDRLKQVFPQAGQHTDDAESETEKPAKSQTTKPQNLSIQIERKGRGGKTATIVSGFAGTHTALEELARLLKNKLGTGGAAKEGQIIIQGDLREKLMQVLAAMGHKPKRGW